MQEDSKVVGVDPSLNRTAIAYLNAAGNPQTEVLEQSAKAGKTLRLMKIAQFFDHKGFSKCPDLVAVEGPIMSVRGKGTTGRLADIGEMYGVMKLLCMAEMIDMIVIPPTVLQKYVTGRGDAPKGTKKQAMMSAIKRVWGENFSDDDRADAFAAMKFGQAWLGEEETLPLPKTLSSKITIIRASKEMKSIAESFLPQVPY